MARPLLNFVSTLDPAVHETRGFPVATFLATSLDLPFETVGLLIAADWFVGIFLNIDGDTLVAMLVANADDSDRDVYNGTKTVTVAAIDLN